MNKIVDLLDKVLPKDKERLLRYNVIMLLVIILLLTIASVIHNDKYETILHILSIAILLASIANESIFETLKSEGRR